MNFKEILELIDKVAESEIGGVEIEQAGTKIRIEGKPSQQQVITSYVGDLKSHQQLMPSIPVTALPAPSATDAGPAAKAAPEAQPENTVTIKSPMVGTFFRSPAPEAPPYVEVGSRVNRGQPICILEAMKLMNVYESEVQGVVVKIYPQSGHPVEYDEPLFLIRLD